MYELEGGREGGREGGSTDRMLRRRRIIRLTRGPWRRWILSLAGGVVGHLL